MKRANLSSSKNIEVATVDFYQGREKDIIFFSCVRAGGNRGIGFLSDIRRMNVAITRAKYSLWIVGNQLSLQKNPDWNQLIKHAKDRRCIRYLQYQPLTKRYNAQLGRPVYSLYIVGNSQLSDHCSSHSFPNYYLLQNST